MYKCICGREFDNKQAYNSHQGRCKVNRESKGREVIDTFNKHNKNNGCWNKGLTKATDIRLKRSGELYSKKVKNGEIIPSFKGKKHTKETKKKMSDTAKRQVKEGTHFVYADLKRRNTPSYPEQWLMKVIENNVQNKEYIREYKFHTFSLDFAWLNSNGYKKCIEMDGRFHEFSEVQKDCDRRKDALLKEEGWLELRLNWSWVCNNSKEAIQKVIDFIDNT